MKNTETMEMADDSEDYGLRLVAEHPIRNAFWFTVMRAVRFIAALLCEAVALVGCVLFGVFGWLTAMWAGAFVLLVFAGLLCSLVGDHWSWADDNFYLREFALQPGQVPQYPVAFFLGKNPYIVAVPAFVLMTVAWAQALAFGLPYRWKNMPPGSSAVVCGTCEKETLPAASCGNCGAPRLMEHVALKVIWAVNVCITSLWVAHDCIFGFVGFTRGR